MKTKNILASALTVIAMFALAKNAWAQVDVLVRNQSRDLRNIIVDASKVYWVNAESLTIDSTNKTTPGSPNHSFCGAK